MISFQQLMETSQSVAAVIISVALMLFSGFLMTRITKLLRLPNVTAYIGGGYPHRTVLSRPRAAAHHRRDGFSVRHRAGVHRVFDRRILQALGAQKKRHEGRLDHAV